MRFPPSSLTVAYQFFYLTFLERHAMWKSEHRVMQLCPYGNDGPATNTLHEQGGTREGAGSPEKSWWTWFFETDISKKYEALKDASNEIEIWFEACDITEVKYPTLFEWAKTEYKKAENAMQTLLEEFRKTFGMRKLLKYIGDKNKPLVEDHIKACEILGFLVVNNNDGLNDFMRHCGGFSDKEDNKLCTFIKRLIESENYRDDGNERIRINRVLRDLLSRILDRPTERQRDDTFEYVNLENMNYVWSLHRHRDGSWNPPPIRLAPLDPNLWKRSGSDQFDSARYERIRFQYTPTTIRDSRDTFAGILRREIENNVLYDVNDAIQNELFGLLFVPREFVLDVTNYMAVNGPRGIRPHHIHKVWENIGNVDIYRPIKNLDKFMTGVNDMNQEFVTKAQQLVEVQQSVVDNKA
jgi:hypothetical protein